MTSGEVIAVVAYSSLHFDPQREDVPFRNSSAGALAAEVYESASQVADQLVYVDGNQPDSWPRIDGVTHLISIEREFESLKRYYEPKNSLLFAVNQEAKASLKKWKAPVLLKQLPLRSVFRVPEVISRNPDVVRIADKIVMVGDNVTLGTYMQAPKCPAQMHVVSYGAGGSRNSVASAGDSILFIASSIGVRKGSDLVESVLRFLKDHQISSIVVRLVGGPSNSYWKKRIDRWTREFEGIFEFHGWLDTTSEEYLQIVQQAACAVVPSREEGLVGTAVEMIRSGIPTFATVECGLGLRPSEYVLDPTNSEQWSRQIVDAVLRGSAELTTRAKPLLGATNNRFMSCSQVSDVIKRFLERGEVVPHYWVTDDADVFSVAKSESVRSKTLKDYLKSNFESAESLEKLDGVLMCVGLLDGNVTLETVQLRSLSHERIRQSEQGAPSVSELVMGSISSGRLLRVQVLSESEKALELSYSATPEAEVQHLVSNQKSVALWRRVFVAVGAVWIPRKLSSGRKVLKKIYGAIVIRQSRD